MPTKQWRSPVVFPLLLTLVGVVLLLDNFLLLEFIDITALWPLILVVAGAVILLRGDFTLDDAARTFGVTRGSVESAVLEVNSAEIDVAMRHLAREERLIAGQYAAAARPALNVTDNRAQIRLDRSATPWFNFADWDISLAQDLPWLLYISTHLGQVELDLEHVIIEGGAVSTGFGDIQLTSPRETLAPISLRSAFGSIQVSTPLGYKTRIHIEGARTFTVRVDERRYALAAPGLYVARNAEPEAPVVDIHISGAFGDAYLA